MNDFMPKKSYDLTEITRLLLEMRENCIPKAGDAYEDPKRAEKHDALNAAIVLINNPSMISRWISVKDRLPENEKPVLIATKWSLMGMRGLAVSCGFYTNGKTFTGDSDYNWNDGNVDLEYNEEEDEYIVPEGWWESVRYTEEFAAVDEPVIYWMPMPEPPKEE